MLDVLRHQLGYSSLETRFPRKATCLDIYSRCVNAQAPLKKVLDNHFPWCADWGEELQNLFRHYAETKIKQLALDYDDLLLYWFHMVAEENIVAVIREQFDHVLVDEYQDTNLLQAGILRHLFPTGKGLTVVGDDAQSIYSFRSAEIENILGFPQQFLPAAKVISLHENYRSIQPILDLSNALLEESSVGYKNELHSNILEGTPPLLVSVEDEETQSKYIIEKVLASREEGVELKNQAVLFRSGHHTDRLEVELRRHDIPYEKHGGLKFLEAAHVKDVLSILRWVDNPKNRISGFRVLKLLPGIGPRLADKALDFLALHDHKFSALKTFKSCGCEPGLWVSLVALLDETHNNHVPWSEQMTAVVKWYQPVLLELFENAYARNGDIEQLAMLSQQYPSRERFLSELTLDPPGKSGDLVDKAHKDDDYLILSTIHSAKGQEWRNVFIINVADGNFPNEYATEKPDQLEEERRLLNVAITRAKRELHLIQPLKYWVPEQQRFGGAHVYGAKSRFLSSTVESHLRPVTFPDRALAQADKNSGEKVLADIKMKVIGMW
jgi:DNA helicase-2/ATP-dependent DNA helicase PcrA